MPFVSACQWPCCSVLLLERDGTGKTHLLVLTALWGSWPWTQELGPVCHAPPGSQHGRPHRRFLPEEFLFPRSPGEAGEQPVRGRTLGWQAVVVSSLESSHMLKMLREAWPFVRIRQQIPSLGGA